MLNGTATTLSGFTATDNTHFTIKLKQVFSSFLNMLASIYPKAACEAAGDSWGQGTNFIGSGSYKRTTIPQKSCSRPSRTATRASQAWTRSMSTTSTMRTPA
ncbi:MAG: hypothetical protein LKG59_03840 [Atopobiaceae bacterium]|nr:hypothetical protein [Atopobiaceae bacterium]